MFSSDLSFTFSSPYHWNKKRGLWLIWWFLKRKLIFKVKMIIFEYRTTVLKICTLTVTQKSLKTKQFWWQKHPNCSHYHKEETPRVQQTRSSMTTRVYKTKNTSEGDQNRCNNAGIYSSLTISTQLWFFNQYTFFYFGVSLSTTICISN